MLNGYNKEILFELLNDTVPFTIVKSIDGIKALDGLTKEPNTKGFLVVSYTTDFEEKASDIISLSAYEYKLKHKRDEALSLLLGMERSIERD